MVPQPYRQLTCPRIQQSGGYEALLGRTPIGRVGQPEDVAYWYAVLASDHARHVVGIDINVSGGQLLS